MTQTVELTRADAWIYSTLKADVTLQGLLGGASDPRIYADFAPEGATFPLVIFQTQDPGNDVQAVGSVQVMARPLYIVKAVDQTDTYQGNLKTIADRIVALLHRAQGVAGDGIIQFSRRERAFRLAEVSSGLRYLHLGAYLRVWTST